MMGFPGASSERPLLDAGAPPFVANTPEVGNSPHAQPLAFFPGTDAAGPPFCLQGYGSFPQPAPPQFGCFPTPQAAPAAMTDRALALGASNLNSFEQQMVMAILQHFLGQGQQYLASPQDAPRQSKRQNHYWRQARLQRGGASNAVNEGGIETKRTGAEHSAAEVVASRPIIDGHILSEGAPPQSKSDVEESWTKVGPVTMEDVDERIRRVEDTFAAQLVVVTAELEDMKKAFKTEQASRMEQEAEIKKLRQDLCAVKEAMAAIGKRHADAERELKTECDEQSGRLAQMEKELELVKASREDLSSVVEDARNEMDGRIQKVTLTNASATAELAKAQSTMQAELRALKQAVDESLTQRRTIDAEVEKLASMEGVVNEQLSKLKVDMDVAMAKLTSVSTSVDATVKDAVNLAVKDGVANDLEQHVKAAAASMQVSETFDVFVHLHLGYGGPASATLVRSDGSRASETLPKACTMHWSGSFFWVVDVPGLQHRVAELLDNNGFGAARWTYVFGHSFPLGNVSHVLQEDLLQRGHLLEDSALKWWSLEWFQKWLRSSGERITEKDVRSARSEQ